MFVWSFSIGSELRSVVGYDLIKAMATAKRNTKVKTPESVFWGPRLPELSLITWVRSVT